MSPNGILSKYRNQVDQKIEIKELGHAKYWWCQLVRCKFRSSGRLFTFQGKSGGCRGCSMSVRGGAIRLWVWVYSTSTLPTVSSQCNNMKRSKQSITQ